MTRRVRIALYVGILIVLLAFIGRKILSIIIKIQPSVTPPVGTLLQEDTQHVLFIGNSHTTVHNIPAIVQQLVTSLEGWRPIEIQTVAINGSELMDLWRSELVPPVLEANRWDHVALQPRSVELILTPDETVTAVRGFQEMIQPTGAQLFLWEGWNRDKIPGAIGQASWSLGTEVAARKAGVSIAPIGAALQLAHQKWPAMAMHLSDGNHLSAAGAYVTASVLAASFYEQPTYGATSSIIFDQGTSNPHEVSFTQAEARLLQEAAWEAIEAWKAPPRPILPALTSVSDGLVLARFLTQMGGYQEAVRALDSVSQLQASPAEQARMKALQLLLKRRSEGPQRP